MKVRVLLRITFILSFLAVGMTGATDFTIHTNMDMPGLDIPSSEMLNPIDVPRRASPSAEVFYCQNQCDINPRCMAFTWVRSGVHGHPTARCWFKSSTRLFEPNCQGLMTFNTNMATGVKIYWNRPCWARHIFNLKFCNVVFAGESDYNYSPTSVTLECPQGSTRVRDHSTRNISGNFPEYCVVRLSHDPGGLPNCTDEFGGEAHTSGVFGSYINHACLDAN